MIVRIAIPDAPERTGTEFDRSVKERLEKPQPVKLPSYTVQQLNAETPSNNDGVLVICSNGNAGEECLAFCNGRAWFVVALGNRISLT